MKKITIDDKEFIITDEQIAMEEKLKEIYDDVFWWGSKVAGISAPMLKEFGTWIYRHRHTYDKASIYIYKMLLHDLNAKERDIVWESFEENFDADFGKVTSFLLEVLNERLSKDEANCRDIVYNYLDAEAGTSDSYNYKYFVQKCISEDTKWVAEDVVNNKVKAPKHIKKKCKKLLSEYTDDYGIRSYYIGHLIGVKSQVKCTTFRQKMYK